jgi:protein-disulfide isomerase
MEKHTVAVETHDRSTRSDTIIILLIVSILLNLIALYFLVGGVFPKKEVMTTSGTTVSAPPPAFTLEKNLYDTIMKVEYEKVGGKENYDLINQANLKQLQTNLPQIRQYLENTGSTAQGQNDPNQPTPSNNGTFTSEEVLALTKDAYVEGNKDANIILIEYSDIECPFCIRQVNETKPFNAMKEKYGDTVSHTFKNNK